MYRVVLSHFLLSVTVRGALLQAQLRCVSRGVSERKGMV